MLSSSAPTDARRATRVATALGRLAGWLESMRCPQGYGGPVVHWWESCLLYCGPMLDWRYEGILTGYVRLFHATGHPLWLERARVAGDDLLAGQLPDGSFRNSNFQFGANERGTPHEAAADVGLLHLARALRDAGDPRAERYLAAAERNLVAYHLNQLWDGHHFRDQTWNRTVVANKNATTAEALLLLAELTGADVSRYVLGAADLILNAQVHAPGPRHGGTVHLGTGPDALVIGFYTARCLQALVSVYEHFGEERHRRALADATDFLVRQVERDGIVFGYYQDGQTIANPRWVSPAGDVLEALRRAAPYHPVAPAVLDGLVDTLLAAQLPSGGIPTARGSARRGLRGQTTDVVDFRDVLPVVGWCDKVFRALSALVGANEAIAPVEPSSATVECGWRGAPCRYREEANALWLERRRDGRTLYHWQKGQTFPTIYEL